MAQDIPGSCPLSCTMVGLPCCLGSEHVTWSPCIPQDIVPCTPVSPAGNTWEPDSRFSLYVWCAVFLLFTGKVFCSYRNSHFIRESTPPLTPTHTHILQHIPYECDCILGFYCARMFDFFFFNCWVADLISQKNLSGEFWLWIRKQFPVVCEMALNVFVPFCVFVKWCS